MPDNTIRPLFVLGCPRSGTTVTSTFVASAPDLLDAGELSAMYFASNVAEREYARVPSPYKREYLDSLRAHSAQFMRDLCLREGKSGFVESTPWNMRALPVLADAFPKAVFVVCIRHYAGVIQSMRSSWEQGYTWAGPGDVHRAQLWAEMNSYIDQLPKDRTVFFSYDAMCREPEIAVSELEKQLSAQGVKGPFDRSVLAASHASSSARSTVAVKRADGGTEMQPITFYDKTAWGAADEAAVRDVVAPAVEKIARVTGIQLSLA